MEICRALEMALSPAATLGPPLLSDADHLGDIRGAVGKEGSVVLDVGFLRADTALWIARILAVKAV